MACKSAIYVVNSGSQTVQTGGLINLGSIVRKFGCNFSLSGNGIVINGQGYYDIATTITLTPTATGTVTVSAYKDGTLIPGAVASTTTAAGDTVSMSFNTLIREICPCDSTSTITFVLTGEDATVSNIATVITKI